MDTKNLKTWPARVWLQVDDAVVEGGERPPYDTLDEVSWADSQVFTHDVEYARVDLASPPQPAAVEAGEGVTAEQLQNLIARAGAAYPGPYMVELTGTRHRFFLTNGGSHVLRQLLSEYELNEYTPEAADHTRATDAYMAAADPQTIGSIAREVIAHRAAKATALPDLFAPKILDPKSASTTYEENLLPPVPPPGICAGRDYRQGCVRQHCDCWYEDGCPLNTSSALSTRPAPAAPGPSLLLLESAVDDLKEAREQAAHAKPADWSEASDKAAQAAADVVEAAEDYFEALADLRNTTMDYGAAAPGDTVGAEAYENLRAAAVKNMLHEERGLDDKYLIIGQRSFTRRQLAAEIEAGTADGTRILTSMVNLAAHLVSRNKHRLPDGTLSATPAPTAAPVAVAQPWVSVTERLPEHYMLGGSHQVLCYLWNGNCVVGYYDHRLKKWFEYMEHPPIDVKHWQPLPTPPQIGEQTTNPVPEQAPAAAFGQEGGEGE